MIFAIREHRNIGTITSSRGKTRFTLLLTVWMRIVFLRHPLYSVDRFHQCLSDEMQALLQVPAAFFIAKPILAAQSLQSAKCFANV